jgi:hypothetical protein
MTEILDIFADKPVEPSRPIGAELYPTLPVIIEPNPVDVAIPEAEEEEVIGSDIIDYGDYDPRENDVDFRFSAPALNGVPSLGMPISAYRILLGSYSFTYGAHDHISVNQKHVIVRFPVADRNGTIKQTTGSDDVDYQWEGNIVSKNIQDDMKAIRAISEAGEPVDFFYLGQKKKVLLEQFDYEIFHNCRAKYTIKVTEYYPQKIKFIPVRVDPLIPERWGILPPISPLDPADPDADADNKDCVCRLMYEDGNGKVIRVNLWDLSQRGFKYPEGILTPEIQSLFGDLDTWVSKTIATVGFFANVSEVFKRIASIALNLMLRWADQNGYLACLYYLFQKCPREQENFYKDMLIAYLRFGVYVEYDGKKYALIHINADGNIQGGNANYYQMLEDIEAWFEKYLRKPGGGKYTRAEIYSLLRDAESCDDFSRNVEYEETTRLGVYQTCVNYRMAQFNRDRMWDKGRDISETITLTQLLGGDPFLSTKKSTIVFELPSIKMSAACIEWCEKHTIPGLKRKVSNP